MWEDSPALTSQYLDGIQVSIADYLPLLFDKDRSTFKQLERRSILLIRIFGGQSYEKPEKDPSHPDRKRKDRPHIPVKNI